MQIKLKGKLDRELLSIGLKPGDIIENTSPVQKNKAVHFSKFYRGHEYNCSVWPENYTIIREKQAKKVNQKGYGFYVVNPKTKKIITGWEFKSDAQDFVTETNPNLKVYSKKYVIEKLKVNPDQNDSWSGDLGSVKYKPIEESILYGLTPNNWIPEIKIRFNKGIHFGKVSSSKDVYEVLKKIYGEKIDLQEQFIVLLLDNDQKVQGYYKHSIGSPTRTIVDIPMIMGMILKSMSRTFIISHNHPDGNNQPSMVDLTLTKEFSKAASYLRLPFLDHLIVTKNNGYYSFREKGHALNGIPVKVKTINGKQYVLRENTHGATRKQLSELAKYGLSKGLISSYRIIKVGSEEKLYICREGVAPI